MRILFKFSDAFERLDPFPPFLKDGLLISAVLHLFVLVIIMVSPYIHIATFSPRIKYDEPIIVNLDDVIIAKETVLPPAPSPKPEQPKPAKAEEIPKPAEASTTPAPATKDDKSVPSDAAAIEEIVSVTPKKDEKPANLKERRIGAVSDLLASVDGLKKAEPAAPAAPVEIKKGIEATSIDAGTSAYQENSTADFLKKQISVSYIDAIRIKLRGCWNIDPGAKGIKDMKIAIRAEFSADGNIKDIGILNADEYAGSPWFKAVADSARRALIVCSPYANLPEAFYDEWKTIVFTFYPDKKNIQ
ncbi:MAG: hypothetical protein LBI17_00065 [Rickettsiales bacterium]|jgi:colicin import membrane protein|nr:hypothetical protein [Rickettsiales bacterium]